MPKDHVTVTVQSKINGYPILLWPLVRRTGCSPSRGACRYPLHLEWRRTKNIAKRSHKKTLTTGFSHSTVNITAQIRLHNVGI